MSKNSKKQTYNKESYPEHKKQLQGGVLKQCIKVKNAKDKFSNMICQKLIESTIVKEDDLKLIDIPILGTLDSNFDQPVSQDCNEYEIQQISLLKNYIKQLNRVAIDNIKKLILAELSKLQTQTVCMVRKIQEFCVNQLMVKQNHILKLERQYASVMNLKDQSINNANVNLYDKTKRLNNQTQKLSIIESSMIKILELLNSQNSRSKIKGIDSKIKQYIVKQIQTTLHNITQVDKQIRSTSKGKKKHNTYRQTIDLSDKLKIKNGGFFDKNSHKSSHKLHKEKISSQKRIQTSIGPYYVIKSSPKIRMQKQRSPKNMSNQKRKMVSFKQMQKIKQKIHKRKSVSKNKMD